MFSLQLCVFAGEILIMTEVIKSGVRALRAYTLPAYRASLKLNQNENPWDAPAHIKQEVLRRFAERKWSQYPDFVPASLNEHLAGFSGWRADGIIAGNGSNELIQAVLMVTMEPGKTLLLSVPCLVAFVLVPDLIMRALFSRGAFTAADAAVAGATLAAYAIGLLPFVLMRSVSVTFLARGDTATPVKALLLSVIVNVVLKITLMSRYAQIGVFSSGYPDPTARWYRFPGIVLGNYLEHVSVRFLFISGDSNPRHSTQRFGQLGWLEILAVSCAIALVLWQRGRFYQRSRPLRGAGIYAWCAATGFVPAALTWESLPHALRSVSVWPFWATGALS